MMEKRVEFRSHNPISMVVLLRRRVQEDIAVVYRGLENSERLPACWKGD
jgi:hypothetical protein